MYSIARRRIRKCAEIMVVRGDADLEVSSSSETDSNVADLNNAENLERKPKKSLSPFNHCRCLFFGSVLLMGAVALLFQPASGILSAHRAASIQRNLLLEEFPTKIVFVVTTSIDPEVTRSEEKAQRETDVSTRIQQYRRGIASLQTQISMAELPLPYEIVAVENNGPRHTFLDEIDGISVVYTDSNQKNEEKGLKELDDVLAVIDQLQMGDSDLLVKMTGRYYFESNPNSAKDLAPFMATLRDMNIHQTRAVVKFGSYARPVNRKIVDCVTGLIAVPVAVLRKVERVVPIEQSWARAVLSLPEDEVHAVQGNMGIKIAPAGRPYYLV